MSGTPPPGETSTDASPPGTALTRPPLPEIEVIVPNFKRRLSGVTATIARLVPIQADRIALATLGPGLPDGFPDVGIPGLLRLPRSRPGAARGCGTPGATPR